MAERACTFCTRPLMLGRAREHVFPDWLLREWKVSDKLVNPTHQSSKGDVLSARHHTLDGLLLGSVCDRCNSGWLSSLESDVKMLLLDLASRRRALASLQNTESLLLSRWAFKTAITLNHASNYRRLITPQQIAFFYARRRLPTNVFTFAHQGAFGEDISWAQDTTWPGTFPEEWSKEELQRQTRDLYQQGFKIRFLIGSLALMSASVPNEHYDVVANPDIHFPLELGSRVAWKRHTSFAYESEREMIVKFGLCLAVKIKAAG